jgi:hypothetical protein
MTQNENYNNENNENYNCGQQQRVLHWFDRANFLNDTLFDSLLCDTTMAELIDPQQHDTLFKLVPQQDLLEFCRRNTTSARYVCGIARVAVASGDRRLVTGVVEAMAAPARASVQPSAAAATALPRAVWQRLVASQHTDVLQRTAALARDALAVLRRRRVERRRSSLAVRRLRQLGKHSKSLDNSSNSNNKDNDVRELLMAVVRQCCLKTNFRQRALLLHLSAAGLV